MVIVFNHKSSYVDHISNGFKVNCLHISREESPCRWPGGFGSSGGPLFAGWAAAGGFGGAAGGDNVPGPGSVDSGAFALLLPDSGAGAGERLRSESRGCTECGGEPDFSLMPQKGGLDLKF
jgi:hypothetical protein